MQRKNKFKKILSGFLASTMIVGSLMTSSINVSAGTTASDGGSDGYHDWAEGSGDFCCPVTNSTIYRIVPIYVGDSISSAEDGSTVTLSYKDKYYRYRSIALYTTERESDRNTYAYLAPNITDNSTINAQVLNSDGSYNFSSIGLDVDLPTHDFGIGNQKYVSFSDTLNSTIIESDGSQNVLDIFDKYIGEMNSRRDSLSTLGKARLDELISISKWGTSDFVSGARDFAFSIELCSWGIENSSNSHFVVSYGDLIYGPGSDIYYPYELYKKAASDGVLLTWSATFNNKSITAVPEQKLGESTYFCSLDKKTQSETRAQAVNISLSLDSELRADISNKDVSKNLGVVTSEKNPDVSLGDDAYKTVMNNVYDNSIASTQITLSDGSTVLKTEDKSGALNTLSGKSDYSSNSVLLGYQTLSIPISADSYSLNALSSCNLSGALQNITASTKTTAVSNGIGNTYGLNFKVNDKTVRSSVSDAIKTANGVSSVDADKTLNRIGTISNMADLQSSALISSKIEGRPSDGSLSEAKGTAYATISYLAQDKQITNKNAQVYINANANVETMKSIETSNHSVTSTNKWGIEKKSKTYVYTLAWKSSDYNYTDGKALAEAMLSSLGETYVLRGNAGISTISKAFTNVTGKSALSVKYNTGNSIEVGATSSSDGSLVGINTLTILVSQELPLNVSSTDYVDSNELNFVYPNLLGYKSTLSSIAPMSAYLTDVVYPYTVSDNNSGNLVSFGGSKLHYYFEPTGLFGVYANSVKSMNGVSYPSYAYNLSRGLWGDTLVASNYRGLSSQDDSTRNDIINNLGLSIGATGNTSSVTAGENVDGTISTKKSDKYKFTASILRKWYTTETNADGSTYQQEHTETVEEHNNYSITHSLNKYTCAALDTALNTGANKAAFNIQGQNNLGNKVTMVTQSSKTLTVYPEVAYKYYQTSVSNGVLNSVKPLTVYVMGEKARTMQPSSLRGIDMDYNYGSNVADGKVVSDGASVGSDSYSMSDGKMVLTSGTDITMSANHSVDYRLISYSLDVVDQYNGVSVRNEFSPLNADYNPADEHDSYVKSFMDNVVVDTYMTIGTKEYEMKTSNTAPVVKNATATTSISIKFKDGVIDSDSKTSIINDMASEYSISNAEATQMFESAGFEKQLQAMFESNISSYNNSKNKWYSEESVTLCVRKYVTTVDLKQVLVQDKVDYNAVGAVDINTNKAVDGVFTMSVSLPESFFSCNLANANKLFEKQTIKGTEFKVTSASTHDFIK